MKKNKLKKLGKASLIVVLSLIGLALIVPLLIKPEPLEGLKSIDEKAGISSRFVTIPFDGTDGIDLHYVESGEPSQDQPVFILLHGSLYNLYSWDRVLDFFGTRGMTYAYDQIPYGLSEKLLARDWSGPNPYTPEAAVKQLVSFMDAMDSGGNIYLVGSSYGGTLAVRTALEYPDRIKGLILVDAAVFVEESLPSWLIKSTQMANLGPLMARVLGKNQEFYKSCYADGSSFTSERQDNTMNMTDIENWDFALWEYLKAWGEKSSFNIENQIPEIDVPVLVISGAEDGIVPVEQSEKLDSLLRKSEFSVIDAAGHMPHEESPEDFKAIVEGWFKKQNL